MLLIVILAIVAVSRGGSQTTKLKPFAAQTNFMSQSGYLRWVVFQQTGNWITYAEAERIVK